MNKKELKKVIKALKEGLGLYTKMVHDLAQEVHTLHGENTDLEETKLTLEGDVEGLERMVSRERAELKTCRTSYQTEYERHELTKKDRDDLVDERDMLYGETYDLKEAIIKMALEK